MQRKGETMKNYNSLLTLQKLVFDKIEFDRKGFKNKKMKLCITSSNWNW